jgi:hypothetical protein
MLYQDTLAPWLIDFEEELELQLLPEYPGMDDVEIEFDLAEKLKGSFEEQATVLQTATGAPYLTRNEARGRVGLGPVAGGDQLVTPLNVLVGAQASPTDSAPPDIGTAARRMKRSTKAYAANLPNDVLGWHAKHVEILSSFFQRQGSAVSSRLGAGQTPDDAFDMSRWNDELTTDLTALSVTMADDVAGATATRFGGEYDASRAFGWLSNNARIAAEKINASTRDQIVAAVYPVHLASRGRKDDVTGGGAQTSEDFSELGDPLDQVASFFNFSQTTRADQLAIDRTTTVGNFSRVEGATQVGVREKVWITNSDNPRPSHLGIDGEVVPISENFSNGGMWPGDPSLGADESAGCTCSVDFNP